MRTSERWLIIALLVTVFGIWGTHAQTGNVVFFTSTAGTTKAVNCPTSPSGPSMCLVGDGFWIWQNATIGWCQPGISCPIGTVPSVSLTLNGTTKTLPASFTIASTQAAPAVTVN